MDKYIERSKYGFFELRYVSENGSAGPDFPDLWGNPPGGIPQHIYRPYTALKRAVYGLFTSLLSDEGGAYL